MTTLPGRNPFALSCLLAIALSQVSFSDSEIIPVGRRRERISRKASKELPTHTQAQPVRKRSVDDKPVVKESVPVESPAPEVEPVQPVPVENSAPEVEPAQPVAVPAAKVDPLLMLAERAISKTSQRYLDANEHTPWQIMHGVVALRRDFELTRGNSKVNCIDFLSNSPTFRGEQWFQATRHGGRAHPFSVAYAFEGHANQFLALLSMSNLPRTHEFKVANGRVVTMADMIRNAKMTVNSHEEITWTLWFLTHYLDIDAEWTNENGEPWSLEELVRLQTNATVTNAPCGGTHGMFAIAYARNAFLHKHGRLHGVYYQAERKIQQHIELARSLQNYDGSFSSEFFKGPGHSPDFNERLKGSGHMLEWLMMALPQRRLNEAWVRRAVASIATDLIHNASQPAKCGPLYHALNSLIMYRDRMESATTPTDEPEQPELAVDPTQDNRQVNATTQPEETRQAAPSPSLARNPVTEKLSAPADTEPIEPLLVPDLIEFSSEGLSPAAELRRIDGAGPVIDRPTEETETVLQPLVPGIDP